MKTACFGQIFQGQHFYKMSTNKIFQIKKNKLSGLMLQHQCSFTLFSLILFPKVPFLWMSYLGFKQQFFPLNLCICNLYLYLYLWLCLIFNAVYCFIGEYFTVTEPLWKSRLNGDIRISQTKSFLYSLCNPMFIPKFPSVESFLFCPLNQSLNNKTLIILESTYIIVSDKGVFKTEKFRSHPGG